MGFFLACLHFGLSLRYARGAAALCVFVEAVNRRMLHRATAEITACALSLCLVLAIAWRSRIVGVAASIAIGIQAATFPAATVHEYGDAYGIAFPFLLAAGAIRGRARVAWSPVVWLALLIPIGAYVPLGRWVEHHEHGWLVTGALLAMMLARILDPRWLIAFAVAVCVRPYGHSILSGDLLSTVLGWFPSVALSMIACRYVRWRRA